MTWPPNELNPNHSAPPPNDRARFSFSLQHSKFELKWNRTRSVWYDLRSALGDVPYLACRCGLATEQDPRVLVSNCSDVSVLLFLSHRNRSHKRNGDGNAT